MTAMDERALLPTELAAAIHQLKSVADDDRGAEWRARDEELRRSLNKILETIYSARVLADREPLSTVAVQSLALSKTLGRHTSLPRTREVGWPPPTANAWLLLAG